ncbi:MAG: pseudoazurin [Pseudomonadota bacterium]
MAQLIQRRTVLVGMSALAIAGPTVARASTEHTVEMLNRDPDDRKRAQIFKPLITTVEPGDSIVFASTDRGHNSQSDEDMIPEGVEGWKGKLNDNISVTFEKPGVYGYRCLPHYALGMVGLVIVRGEGMADNLEAAMGVRHRGRAGKVWEEIWAQVESENLMA